MTYDLDAHQAASLLQAAYIRMGQQRRVFVDNSWVVISNELHDDWVAITPKRAMFHARTYWGEIDGQ